MKKPKFTLKTLNKKGQTSVEFILVVAVLAIGIAAAFYAPEFQNSFANLYNNAGSRIIKPGK